MSNPDGRKGIPSLIDLAFPEMPNIIIALTLGYVESGLPCSQDFSPFSICVLFCDRLLTKHSGHWIWSHLSFQLQEPEKWVSELQFASPVTDCVFTPSKQSQPIVLSMLSLCTLWSLVGRSFFFLMKMFGFAQDSYASRMFADSGKRILVVWNMTTTQLIMLLSAKTVMVDY